MSSFWGLCYYHPLNRVPVSLHLVRVEAHAVIKELSAQVKLTQAYRNDTHGTIDAVYSFPVPARASVCGFVMIRQDGTRVKGVVEEKEEAQNIYDEAVADGKTASLMTQQTPDVFQVSVGNIPTSEQVNIELLYATELTEDEDTDSIRFHLPAYIGSRYGAAPAATSFLSSTPSDAKYIIITTSVEAMAPIKQISCPSHPISTELGPDPDLPSASNLPYSNYARVSLSSDAPLQKDFVLAVKSAGLDSPRCVAELHPVYNTVAIALTLVPRFNLPDRPNQEFIFLVDRSGSMGHRRIEAARKALVIMLRSLPHKATSFQIASFGSSASLLWQDGSKLYNQETLDEATRHVDGMTANYGGTEIRSALALCFQRRDKDRATNVFLLTDGDAWDLAGLLDEVTRTVDEAPVKAPLRVFCLGIGDSASTAMCQGIARVGNGACMMVGEQEQSTTGKIARLVKAAKSPVVKDIRVDWGRSLEMIDDEPEEFELVDHVVTGKQPAKATLNIFDETATHHMDIDPIPIPPPPPIELPPPVQVQQSPRTVKTLLPSVRFYAYAILQGKESIPKTVYIKAKTEDDTDIDLPVTVVLSHLPNESTGAPPAIHALAARKMIQDYEDGQYRDLLKKDPSVDAARLLKAHVVRLGKTYSISSAHTSFVAVDESSPAQPRRSAPNVAPPKTATPFSATPFSAAQMSVRHKTAAPATHVFGSPPPHPQARPSPVFFGQASPHVPTASPLGGGIGAIGFSAPRAPAPSRYMVGSAGVFGTAAPPPPAAASGLFGHSSGSSSFGSFGGFGSYPVSSVQASPGTQAPALAPAEVAVDGNLMQAYEAELAAVQSWHATSVDLETLARLQAFDGSFSMSVLSVVNPALNADDARAVFDNGLSDDVIATVLAMAFISGQMSNQKKDDKVAWAGIYEKAEAFLEDALEGTHSVDALFIKVVDLIAYDEEL